MINLLPTDKKAEIRAARTNTIISRYAGIVLAAVLFCVGVLYVSHMLLEQTMKSTKNRADTTNSQANSLGATDAQVQALSAKLTESKQLLDQEVRYSKLLTKLGQSMPANTVLDSIALNESSFNGTPTTLRVYAKSVADTNTLTQNLHASQLFSQVAVQTTDPAGGIDGYPVSVTLSGTFTKTGAQ